MRRFLAALSMMMAMSVAGSAWAYQPGIIFDMGGKFDKSFNEAAYTGAERFKQATGIQYLEFEITNESQREQFVRRMVRDGADLIVLVGFAFTSVLDGLASDYPDTEFVIIDSVVELPNVRSVVFKEHEGSFLVGMAAAMASESGKVGFVGGMDVPLIRNFLTGYEQGVAHANANVEVLANMTGDTPSAWNDPTRGGELAKSQFDRGADVVYHAAGATGLGVLQAAADSDKLGIGVDSNQNYLHPGNVLTSMIKRVDVAVDQAFSDGRDGSFTTGLQSLGLAEDGVGYSFDDFNRELMTPEMQRAIEEARAQIIAGELVVEPYQASGN